MAISYEFSIAPNIRDLIQAKTCEPIICSLMNESHDVFPSKYKHIKNQPNNECDIIDIVSKQKYDVKIQYAIMIIRKEDFYDKLTLSGHAKILQCFIQFRTLRQRNEFL